MGENCAKLCDFGSAKILAAGQKNIAYICSRYYRAPELLLGATDYTSQVDIWSLGCVIAEMLTNHSLFDGSNATSMLLKIVRTIGCPSEEDLKAMKLSKNDLDIMAVEPQGLGTRIRKLNGKAGEELVKAVEAMLVYNPEKRITARDALMLAVFQ